MPHSTHIPHPQAATYLAEACASLTHPSLPRRELLWADESSKATGEARGAAAVPERGTPAFRSVATEWGGIILGTSGGFHEWGSRTTFGRRRTHVLLRGGGASAPSSGMGGRF